MSMRRTALCAATLALVLGASAARAETPGLGQPISEADIAAWDISILPDGSGLPAGQRHRRPGRDDLRGEMRRLPRRQRQGRNRWAAVVGSPPLDRIDAAKTIANFWGYPTTVFDFIRRAMPCARSRARSTTTRSMR